MATTLMHPEPRDSFAGYIVARAGNVISAQFNASHATLRDQTRIVRNRASVPVAIVRAEAIAGEGRVRADAGSLDGRPMALPMRRANRTSPIRDLARFAGLTVPPDTAPAGSAVPSLFY